MQCAQCRTVAFPSSERPLLMMTAGIAAALFLWLATGVSVAYAQESDAPASDAASAAASEAALDAVVTEVIQEDAPSAAVQSAITADTEVAFKDFGANDARVLPDNPFYAFKRGWRGFRKATTFNPVKDAALRLKYANQEFADANKLADQKGAGELAAVEAAIARAQEGMGAIAERTASLREQRGTNRAAVDALLDAVADRSITQQKALDRIEEHVADELTVEVRERFTANIAAERERVLEHVGQVVGAVDVTQAVGRFQRALDHQRGSDFKHFKNIEVLDALEEKVPEEARAAIRAAKEQAVERMTERLEGDAGHLEQFEAYVGHLPGDAVRHFEILDNVRTTAELPTAFREKMDAMKLKAVGKFNREFETRSAAERDRMLGAFRGTGVDGVRVAEQFKNFVPPEARVKIEQEENASIEQFKAKFAGQATATGEAAEAVADEAKRLMEKVRTNPDPTDFILLEKLKEKLTPEQQSFVRQLEDDGAKRFAEEFNRRGGAFLEQFADPSVPHSLEVLEGLRARGVPGVGIDRAIAVQRERFAEHLSDLEDPMVLGNIHSALEFDPELKQSFEAGDPAFFQNLEAKRGALEQRGEELRSRIEEKVRTLFENPDAAISDDPDLPPGLRAQIERQREHVRSLMESGGDGGGAFSSGGFPGPMPPEGMPGGFPDGMLPGGFPGAFPNGAARRDGTGGATLDGQGDGSADDSLDGAFMPGGFPGLPSGDGEPFGAAVRERVDARVQERAQEEVRKRIEGAAPPESREAATREFLERVRPSFLPQRGGTPPSDAGTPGAPQAGEVPGVAPLFDAGTIEDRVRTRVEHDTRQQQFEAEFKQRVEERGGTFTPPDSANAAPPQREVPEAFPGTAPRPLIGGDRFRVEPGPGSFSAGPSGPGSEGVDRTPAPSFNTAPSGFAPAPGPSAGPGPGSFGPPPDGGGFGAPPAGGGSPLGIIGVPIRIVFNLLP